MTRARLRGGGSIAALLWASLILLSASPLAAGPTEDAAREHAKRATAAYNLGQYAEAATEFEAAYKLVLDPMLLFNVAQSQRLAGQLEKALIAYRAFLRTAPPGADRTQAEKWRAELEKKVASPPPAPAVAPPPAVTPAPMAAPAPVATPPPAAPPPPPAAPAAVLVAPAAAPPRSEPTPPLYARWWLWAVVGAAVAAGAGVLFFVERDRSNPDCRGIQPCGSI